MAEFKVGDTVKLRSGGPVMTVEEIDHTVIYTVWFIDAKKCNDKFNESTLKIWNMD